MKNHNGYSPNRLLKRLNKALLVSMSSISFSRGITNKKSQNISKCVEENRQDSLMSLLKITAKIVQKFKLTYLIIKQIINDKHLRSPEKMCVCSQSFSVLCETIPRERRGFVVNAKFLRGMQNIYDKMHKH